MTQYTWKRCWLLSLLLLLLLLTVTAVISLFVYVVLFEESQRVC
jgi:hypothetical protein